MRSKRMRSKRMRSKSKTTKKSMRMRSKSKSMRSKSTKKSMRSKTTKKSKSKSTRRKMRGGNSVFQPAPTPTPGAAYFAGSSDKLPHGTHYSPSAVGIPAGSFDPAIRAGAWPTQAAGGKSMRNRNMHGMLNRSMGMGRSMSRSGRSMGMGRSRSMGMSRSMGRSRSMHGGGVSSFVSSILPDEIVNIGRSIPASLGHMVDKFNGTISMPSSLVYPTQQPHVYQGSGSTAAPQMPPIDIMSEFNKANLSAPSV